MVPDRQSDHNDNPKQQFVITVAPHEAGHRLDLFLAHVDSLSSLSRSRIQSLVRANHIKINGSAVKPNCIVQAGDVVSVCLPPAKPVDLKPEAVDFQVLYEDDHILVLAKPPGVVVHPSCGHTSRTLVHGLLHHCGSLSEISGQLRPGIVHRLDKDTSGVMVVAKNDASHSFLVEHFKSRNVRKIYLALLDGELKEERGSVNLPIGRHPVNRKKMAVRPDGREALTLWRVLGRFRGFTFVELELKTGRTHQIRVHMADLGCPVAGDAVYGRKNKRYADIGIVRQCLHAHKLSFEHPATGRILQFESPLWPDIRNAIECLQEELQ